MKKKLMSLVLVMAMVLSALPAAAAVEKSPSNLEEQYVISYMKKVFDVEVEVVSENLLQDLSGQMSFTYFELSIEGNLGYAVLNNNTFEIPECALDYIPPIDFKDNIIYAGPLTYLTFDGEKYCDAMLETIFDVERCSAISRIKADSKTLTPVEKAQKIHNIESTRASASTIKMISAAENNSWVYSSGFYRGDCGINCVAMLEKYYDLYVSINYLPPSLDTEAQIKESIYNWCINNLMPTEGIFESYLADIISRHSMSVGVNGYYLYAQASTYSWKTAVSNVNANRPLAISIANDSPYGYHYVIACGYADTGDPSTSRLYINTGWGNEHEKGGFVWIDQSYGLKQITCV